MKVTPVEQENSIKNKSPPFLNLNLAFLEKNVETTPIPIPIAIPTPKTTIPSTLDSLFRDAFFLMKSQNHLTCS